MEHFQRLNVKIESPDISELFNILFQKSAQSLTPSHNKDNTDVPSSDHTCPQNILCCITDKKKIPLND